MTFECNSVFKMLEKEKSNASTCDVFVVGEQVRQQMHRVNLIKDRRHRLRKHRSCFVGRDAVDWLVKMCHAQSRVEAVKAMRCLQERGMIHHVSDDRIFDDQNLFFRFSRDDGEFLLRSDLTAFYQGQDMFNSVKEFGIQRDFYHRGHLCQGAFCGRDLVDCLMARDSKQERADVISHCRELLEFDVIRHVTDDYHFLDDNVMYQFHVDYERSCLLSDVLHQPWARNRDLRRSSSSRSSFEASSSVDGPTSSFSGSETGNMETGSIPSNSFSDSNKPYQEGVSTINDAHVLDEFWGDNQNKSGMLKRTVQLQQDEMGYGFVLSGSSPCYIHTVDPLGPAAAAGMKEGQYLLSVDGQNVWQCSHRHVGQLVMTHTGLLRLILITRKDPEF